MQPRSHAALSRLGRHHATFSAQFGAFCRDYHASVSNLAPSTCTLQGQSGKGNEWRIPNLIHLWYPIESLSTVIKISVFHCCDHTAKVSANCYNLGRRSE